MSETVSVATANTYYSHMIRQRDGLKPFSDLSVDAILLQEVLGIGPEELGSKLDDAGYSVVHSDQESGLAIAVNKSGIFKTEAESNTSYVIEPIGKIGQVAVAHGIPGAQRLRPRKLISTEMQTRGGQNIRLWTTHPIVFVRALARRKQVEAIIDIMSSERTGETATIFAADMNHYPSPRRVDRMLAERVGLQEVPNDEPTWHIKGSKHEWIARIGSLATGKQLEEFDARLDSMWYSGLTHQHTRTLSIASDHKGLVANFEL